MVAKPCVHGRSKRARMAHAFSHSRFRYAIARVVGQISLLAQGIEHDDVIGSDTNGFAQRLNRDLMMSRLAGQGAISIRMQRNDGQLHDRLVRRIKAILCGERRNLRIGDIARRRREQSRHGRAIRRHGGKANAEQILQGHRRFRSGRSLDDS